MIESIAFRTQARTVDHLGREQIADCPTAISELWKNAYDAYARSVSLHIFDDVEPVAAIFDDGHGMDYEEFISRWLVVGTESKFSSSSDNESDRNGLPKRTKQGQKGIGRLSSANLGPLLLLVSKREDKEFVAALIDWRIFENPFLILSDIEIPVTKFESQDQLFEIIPDLFDRLNENIHGSIKDTKRSERLRLAWETYDHIFVEEDSQAQKPSEAISGTIINARFEPRHISPWSVWSGEKKHGTALIVSDINYDLRAQLRSVELDGNIKRIQESFFSTLSAFTDPFVDDSANEYNSFDPDFSYEVKIWRDNSSKTIIEDDRQAINRSITEEMEHVLSGNIDEHGVFRGQIKAFGEWRLTGDDYVINPPTDYRPPKGATTYLGPVGLHVTTYEQMRMSSTLSDEAFTKFENLAEQHAGFLIYRNGLRVLPYGRIENDFFEIETRRSKHAGREFWNARRMFGRVAISREMNPNLRDKAGREGFIDNRSTKALRILVAHILQRAAYEYFGHASELRKELLPDIQAQNKKERAETERKELSKKNAKKFRSILKRNLPEIENLYLIYSEKINSFEIHDEYSLEEAQLLINDINNQLNDLRIVGAPAKLGTAEEDYRRFRIVYADIQAQVRNLTELRSEAIEQIKPAKPEEIAERQLQSLASRLHARLRNWRKSITALQESEQLRVNNLFDERNKIFHMLAQPFVEQVRLGRLGLDAALDHMKEIQDRLDAENENTFQSYLDTLEVMSENINIELIASQGIVDNIALRDDLNRLNQLAQLGITVEIMGHELNSNNAMIREGLKLAKSATNIPALQLIETGIEALSQQLAFLSPLKISGPGLRRKITGFEISNYLKEFFSIALKSRGILIKSSNKFDKLEILEQPSRILPVFVNITNNSIYWLATSKTINPLIELNVIDGKVVISDNGPGIDPLDQESLFKMFFTRKVSGGRGIGLYLCRVNLMSGGHSIEYANERKFQLLSGANFIIDFKGANFD
ncbi:ATP-binding protein [Serratia ureilytica]|uniref:ATP-binding protein n=1 Tax=Serratia TaxID=613 RepID=UPI0019D1409C|nr:ATP-binding protein [Serratia ureilytica]MBN5211091.1 ATP-binding protein [Serratia ureilytica]